MATAPDHPFHQTPLAELIGRVAGGDRVALNVLYDKTSPKLFAVILRVLGNRAASEEVLRESFVKIWRNADQTRHSAIQPMPWLIAIARNNAIDWLRRHPDVIAMGEEFDPMADDLPTLAEMESISHDAPLFYRRLGVLEELAQDLIRRAYFGGGPYEELARKTKIPIGALKSGLRQALTLLGSVGPLPSNVHHLRSDSGE